MSRSHVARPVAKLLLPAEFPTPDELREARAYWSALPDAQQRPLVALPFLPLAARLKDAIRQRCSCTTCQFNKCSFLSQPGDEALEMRFTELRNGQPVCRCGACGSSSANKSSAAASADADPAKPRVHLNRECLSLHYGELCAFSQHLCVRHESHSSSSSSSSCLELSLLPSSSCSRLLEPLIDISSIVHGSFTKDLLRTTCTACAATVAPDLYWAAGVARNLVAAARQEAADLAFQELLNEPKSKAAKNKKSKSKKNSKSKKKATSASPAKVIADHSQLARSTPAPPTIIDSEEVAPTADDASQPSNKLHVEQAEQQQAPLTANLDAPDNEATTCATPVDDDQGWTSVSTRSRRPISPNAALPSPPTSPSAALRLPSAFLAKLCATELPLSRAAVSSPPRAARSATAATKTPSPYRPHFLLRQTEEVLPRAEERAERESRQQCLHPCVVPGCATLCDIPAQLLHVDHSCVKLAPCSQSCHSLDCSQVRVCRVLRSLSLARH